MANGYILRGYGYLIKKNYKEASSDFRAALKIDPENAYAKENLAEINRIEQQTARNSLRRMMGSGDPYTDLYNFGYQLGLDMLLGD